MHRFFAALLGVVVAVGIVNLGDDLTDELGNPTQRALALGAWADIPSFDSDEYRRVRRAYQYNAVAADSLNVNRATVDTLIVDEFFQPPSVSTLPTCDADTEPAILFDTSDNLLKGCSDLSGSFEWNPIGGDVDGDGFAGSGRRPIDANDSDNTVFARNLTADNVKSGTEIGPADDVILRGTLEYAATNTYSGTDAQIDIGGTLRYIDISEGADPTRANVFGACVRKGDTQVVSWTESTGTAATRAYLNIENTTGRDRLGAFLNDPTSTTVWSTRFLTGFVDEFTCKGFEG